MGKYEPLSDLLRRSNDEVSMTFAELDRLIGGLPPSARNHRSWWGNTVNPSHVHASSWVTIGWIAETVDLHAERITFVRGAVDARVAGKRARRGPDGAAQLAAVLESAGYPSTMHAVAAHVSMLHPSVVAQTNGQPVFATVRRDVRRNEPVGSMGEVGGRPVMFDDNRSPTVAFTWAAGYGTGKDVQYNHIWPASRARSSYTALWNMCMTPAFLAKTTDGRNHPDVVSSLRRRAFDLYRCLPDGEPEPASPPGYDELRWAEHPEPVDNLEHVYRDQMRTKPKDRIVTSARELGWCFSHWEPDPTL